MYRNDAQSEVPANDVRIWRYMELAKFVSILNKSSLYFCRVDKLRDPYEGLPSNATKKEWAANGPSYAQTFENFFNTFRQWTYVSSWHMNEHESAAMWELYLKSAEGLAIETTFANLRDCFSKTAHSIRIAKVKYIDYVNEPVPTSDFLATHKRTSFAHERELRAMSVPIFDGVKGMPDDEFAERLKTYPAPAGIDIEIDIACLIRRVFISPLAPIWYVDVVKSLLEKYGYSSIPVTQSDLYLVK